MTRILVLAPLLAALALAGAQPAWSHAGHDEEPVVAAIGTGAPRAEAHSELFELVGVARGDTLTVYLDRFETNEPVSGAGIEVAAGADTARAEPHPDGTYVVRAPWVARPGTLELLFTVMAGEQSDLLTATLRIPAAPHADAPATTGPRAWAQAALGERRGPITAALGFVLGALTILAFQARGRWRALSGATAVVVGMLVAGAALAHEGHAEEPAPTPTADAPRRLPDGSVSMPKDAQRLLAIRTVLAAQTDGARMVQVSGQVIVDPSAAGRVQASQAGRVEAPPDDKGSGSLAHVGQRVAKGDVLALVMPAVGAIERGGVQAQIAELDSAVRLAEQKYRRLSSLVGSVAGREIDDARVELEGVRRRRAALQPSLGQAEALRAPVSGIISVANAQAGSLVEPSAVLFEVVDPARLWVEAVAFDPAIVQDLRGASALTTDGTPLRVAFIGRGAALRQGALPLLFRVEDPPANLAVGTPVTVIVEGAGRHSGIAVPRAAVVRLPSGGQAVWDHVSAERFVPRPVRVLPLDGTRVLLAAGVTAGARVVVQGAELLSQQR